MAFLVWVCVHAVLPLSLSFSLSLCLCMHVPECVVFVSVSTYVSHFSFIALWHLFMIARPQHNSQTAKGVLKNDMYSRHNYRVVVFSVTFAMVTRKYIYRLQLHVQCTCILIYVSVCVTFVESLWLLAPLAYFNNIYVYLTSLCALPSAVLCFPYKLSRTTLEEEVASGTWSCKSSLKYNLIYLCWAAFCSVYACVICQSGKRRLHWNRSCASTELNHTFVTVAFEIDKWKVTYSCTHTHTNTYLEQHACVSQPVVVVARTLGVIMCINHRNTHTHTHTEKQTCCVPLYSLQSATYSVSHVAVSLPPSTSFRIIVSQNR